MFKLYLSPHHLKLNLFCISNYKYFMFHLSNFLIEKYFSSRKYYQFSIFFFYMPFYMSIRFCWRDSCFRKNLSNKISSVKTSELNCEESSSLRLQCFPFPPQKEENSWEVGVSVPLVWIAFSNVQSTCFNSCSDHLKMLILYHVQHTTDL